MLDFNNTHFNGNDVCMCVWTLNYMPVMWHSDLTQDLIVIGYVGHSLC